MSISSGYPVPPGDYGIPGPQRPVPRRVSSLTRRPWFINLLAVAVLLGIWQYLAATNSRVPAIEDIGSFLLVELRGTSHGGANTGEFWPPLSVSLRRYAIGLVIGIPLGTVLGVLIGASSRFRALLNDTVLVMLALPSVVWAFAASLWFGFSDTAPIVAVVLSAAPFMAFNLRSGISAIEPGLAEMSRSFHVPAKRRLTQLLIGGAVPSAITGIRLAFMTSWNSLLIVEWFGATSGVGWRSRFWYDALRYEGFVAWVFLFVVFITLFDWLVLRRLERRSMRWQQQPTLTFGEDDDV